MARDYKNAAAKKKAKARPVGSWVSFVSGLAIGLMVALAVFVLKPGGGHMAQHELAEPTDSSVVYAGPEFDEELKMPERELTFYQILPDVEVKVPDWEIPSSTKSGAEPAADVTYAIQVGSFKQFADADRAKAQLALTGIQANIQRAVINGQDVWYRVNIGPYSSSAELNGMRAKLRASGNKFITLKIKDDAG